MRPIVGATRKVADVTGVNELVGSEVGRAFLDEFDLRKGVAVARHAERFVALEEKLIAQEHKVEPVRRIVLQSTLPDERARPGGFSPLVLSQRRDVRAVTISMEGSCIEEKSNRARANGLRCQRLGRQAPGRQVRDRTQYASGGHNAQRGDHKAKPAGECTTGADQKSDDGRRGDTPELTRRVVDSDRRAAVLLRCQIEQNLAQ